MAILALIFRVLHILAAMAVVGGPMFMRLALLPAAAALNVEQRGILNEQIRRRWSMVTRAAILLLLVSGIYNLVMFIQASHTWGPAWEHGSDNSLMYNTLLGVKLVLAVALFFFAEALTGRSAAFARFRENAKFWVTVNLLLGILIVCIAGQMRMMHVGPMPPSGP